MLTPAKNRRQRISHILKCLKHYALPAEFYNSLKKIMTTNPTKIPMAPSSQTITAADYCKNTNMDLNDLVERNHHPLQMSKM